MTKPLADVHQIEGPPVAIVAITGEIDLSNNESIATQIEAGVDASAVLIIDLSEIEYVDSIGIAMFDQLRRSVAGLSFVAPETSHAGRLLRMVNLGVPIFDSRDEAKRHVG